MNANITRKTKVGFGYTAACENDDRGNLRVCSTERPDYTGTFNQVLESIDRDRTLNSFRSGGTYYSTAWFVKIDGKWHKITDEYGIEKMNDLLMKRDSWDCQRTGQKYYADVVSVDVAD